MTEYNEILNKQRFSFSSVSTYGTCPHAFELNYLIKAPRLSNSFSEFGSFSHKILEMYFTKELESWDLVSYYQEHYNNIITTPFPYPKMGSTYYNEGLKFFENFSFDITKFDIISIEDTINSNYHGIDLVVKPDLILQDKETKQYILIDYKSAKIKDNKIKEDYRHQFLLYSYIYFIEKNIEINKIDIWYLRDGLVKELIIDPFEVQETLDWFENTVNKIRSETEWKPNLSKENLFFCNSICGIKNSCKYRNGEIL